jgi:hypothetical protein
MVGGDTTDTMRQIGGGGVAISGSAAGGGSMSRFLDDSKHTALPQSFLADMETIPSIAAEPAESDASGTSASMSGSNVGGDARGGGGKGQSAADLLFAALDADGDGVITKEEMRKGLARGTKRSPHKRSRGGASGGGGSGSSQRDRLSAKDSKEAEASGVGLLLAKSELVRSHPSPAADTPTHPSAACCSLPPAQQLATHGLIAMQCVCRRAVTPFVRLVRATRSWTSTAHPLARRWRRLS